MCITIQTLYKQGLNQTEIDSATKHDWKTVNKVIKAIRRFNSDWSVPKKLRQKINMLVNPKF